MENIILVKNPKNLSNAEEVLLAFGYKIKSSWMNDNIFEKDKKQFKIQHPVWIKNKVRITSI